MSLATIAFPDGTQIDLGEDGRWSGGAAAKDANAFILPPDARPNWARNVADEIAAAIGGEVVAAVDDDSEIPDDATP